MKEDNLLDVKIYWSPIMEKAPFQGIAEAVSSENHLGNFDILPEHANFISFISKSITLHLKNEKVTHKFDRGVLEISENKVKVFLGV